MIRSLVIILLAAALGWGCGGSPGTDTARSRDSTVTAEPGASSGVARQSASDSGVQADTLPTTVAPFVRPLADAWTGDLDSMISRRVIRVLITPTRTQYWIDRG